MRILRVIDTLDPRRGGPSAGLRALTPALAALGHETVVVTTDEPGAVPSSIPGGEVIPLGPARGGYRFTRALRPWLETHIRDFDAVLVHGLWQYPGRCVRAVAGAARVPYFVYPHGMLDPWFRSAYPGKHLKKWAYWQLCERHVLRDAAAVLFTCEEERRLARLSFAPYACTERVVNYGTTAAPGDAAAQIAAWQARLPELRGRPFLLFLGRLHPKKGADLLLDAYLELAAREAAPPALVFAGPEDDPAWCGRLRARAAQGPKSGCVLWTGHIEGDVKWGALRAAEAFVLPSHQENFGLAVVEALAAGTPALISQRVNIWREIVDDGAGLAEDDTPAGVARLLATWRALAPAERERMRRNAAASHARRFDIGRVTHSFLEVVEPFVRSTALAASA